MDEQIFLDRSFVIRESIDDLLERGLIRLEMSILVLCAGPFDKAVFAHYGFSNVTLSNLSNNLREDDFSPYSALNLDVEDIDLPDNSYDWCVVHAGLHHCANPPAAVLEMYRVAKVGLLAMEPINTLLSRLTVKFGLSQQYEIASVADKVGSSGGGLRFGGIPNWVYRFSRFSVIQTIQTAHPEFVNKMFFYERLGLSWNFLRCRRKPLDRAVLFFEPLIRMFVRCSWLANNIGFAVLVGKIPEDFQQWITEDSEGQPKFDPSYLERGK